MQTPMQVNRAAEFAVLPGEKLFQMQEKKGWGGL